MQIGVFGRPVTVPLDHVFAKELVVTLGLRVDAALLAAGAGADPHRGPWSSTALVSEVVPLDAWERAFGDLRAGRRVKVVFDPRLDAGRSQAPDDGDDTGETSMKIGLLTVLFNDKPLEEVADYAAGLGYEAFELAAWRGSNHFDTDRAKDDPGYARDIKKMLAGHGIEISALSNHLSSQMVLPFDDASLDEWAGTSDKDEMVKLGTEHIIKTAEVASELEVPIVNGFFGSTVWESWYIWPPQRLAIYEQGWELFVERWKPILDRFKELGVRFAHEVPPDRDRLQRLHRARGHQAPATATTGASTSIRAT